MKLYLDSADFQEWEAVVNNGWTRSITCNPLIMESAGWAVDLASCKKLVQKADAMKLHELHIQAWPTADGCWYTVAQQIAEFAPWVVVKLPAIPAAMNAAIKLKSANLKVLITAVSNPLHALWAYQNGLDYVAPYVGRLNEASVDAVELIKSMVELQNKNGPKVLAASIRDLDVLGRLIQLGVGAATARYGLFKKAEDDELAWSAVHQFEAARQRSNAHR